MDSWGDMKELGRNTLACRALATVVWFFLAGCAGTPTGPEDYRTRKPAAMDISNLGEHDKRTQELLLKSGPDVSIVELLANPEKYDGVPVRVTGVLSGRAEDFALYLDSESYEFMIFSNSIVIKSYLRPDSVSESAFGNYVVITGVFVHTDDGSRLTPGYLEHVLPVLPGHVKVRSRKRETTGRVDADTRDPLTPP